MVFIGQEELGRTGFRCELSRGEIIELTLKSLFPDMEQEDMIALREAIDYGINNYQSSHSSVSCGWGRSYSPYFTDSTTDVVLEGVYGGAEESTTKLIDSIRGGNYVNCKTERSKPGSDKGRGERWRGLFHSSRR